MKKDDKILIAGSNGLVGSALIRHLKKNSYINLLTPVRSELDFMDTNAVADYFIHNKPDHIFLAAARVGGILANSTYPADFIYQNLMIQNNIIHQAYINNVQKLLFLGSSCIYPKYCPQPIKEEYLMTGILEPTNSAYAVAKIAGIEMCWAYNRQHDTRFIPVMPTNLYGPNDNFDPETSHVLPALTGKFYGAKQKHEPAVTVWGTGSPKREFLHVDDLADACCFIMNRNFSDSEYKSNPLFNIGTGKDLTIKELAELIKNIIGYKGGIEFDPSKPDGTPQKLLDISRMSNMGWQATISLEHGIAGLIREFENNHTSKHSCQAGWHKKA